MNSIPVPKSAADLIRDFRFGRLQWPLHVGQVAKLLGGHDFGKPWSYWLREIKEAIATGDLPIVGTVRVHPAEMGVMQAQGCPPFVDCALIEKEPLAKFLEAYRDDPSTPLHPLVKAAATQPPSEPVARPVGVPTRSGVDSDDVHGEADDARWNLPPAGKYRLSLLHKTAAAMGIDLLNPRRGNRAALAKDLDRKYPGRFGVDAFNDAWSLGINEGSIKSLKGE